MSAEIDLLAQHESKLQIVRLRAEVAAQIYVDLVSASMTAAQREAARLESIRTAFSFIAAALKDTPP